MHSVMYFLFSSLNYIKERLFFHVRKKSLNICGSLLVSSPSGCVGFVILSGDLFFSMFLITSPISDDESWTFFEGNYQWRGLEFYLQTGTYIKDMLFHKTELLKRTKNICALSQNETKKNEFLLNKINYGFFLKHFRYLLERKYTWKMI